jgi:uncharacterized protein YukE
MTDTNTAQLVADLKSTDDAVRAQGWVAPGLGVPGAPLSLLGSTHDPLSGLATAGLSWFTPLVSFLGEGLTQLRGGDAASVTSGSQDFGDAGQDMAGVADTYRQSVHAQTSGWSGMAATEYRDAAEQHADGITGLGQASTTVSSAIIGAGQVVAQAIAEITELIAEAVAQIVPIMTQAVARAGETFGESVVEAIPPCVGIAVEYALRIAAKLAALVASGDNLLKLVQGGMAVVDLIRTALTSISQQSISQQSVSADAVPQANAGPQGDAPANTTSAVESASIAGTGPSAPMSSGGGASTPVGQSVPLEAATRSSGAIPSQPTGHAGGSGVSTAAAPGSAVPIGGTGLVPGARTGAGRGADSVRQQGGQSTRAAGGGTPGGLPLGATGAGRPADEDKEHQRKYSVVELHDEAFEVAPPVIGG